MYISDDFRDTAFDHQLFNLASLDNEEEFGKLGYRVGYLEDANLVSSRSVNDPNLHYPTIDLDFDAALYPSSTEGHYHLYLGKAVPYDKYLALLEALTAAGLYNKGNLDAFKIRGMTMLRPPWIKKPEGARSS